MVTAMQVAHYIEGKGVYGEVQLQKLLYYSQGWALAWYGRALFPDEIEAWRGGPVVHEVWAAGQAGNEQRNNDLGELDDRYKAVVDAVYATYGTHGGRALSQRTHQEQPWVEARGDLRSQENSRQPLSRATMRKFFTEVALLGEGPIPVAPVLDTEDDVTTERVLEAAGRQKSRWRAALDTLAKQ